MNITFTKRNEEELHCRFCLAEWNEYFKDDLYETKPIKGIVCGNCKEHLEDYLPTQPNHK